LKLTLESKAKQQVGDEDILDQCGKIVGEIVVYKDIDSNSINGKNSSNNINNVDDEDGNDNTIIINENEDNNDNDIDKDNINSIISSDDDEAQDEDFRTEEEIIHRKRIIKLIVKSIYNLVRPEKVNNVGKLLSKYDGHEEEFLLYVFEKYNITDEEGEEYEKKAQEKEIRIQKRLKKQLENNKIKEEAELLNIKLNENFTSTAKDDKSAKIIQSLPTTPKPISPRPIISPRGTNTIDRDSSIRSHSPRTVSPRGQSQPGQSPRDQSPRGKILSSRSMSPTANSRKSKISEELKELKELKIEVKSLYFPKDNDEWMLFETNKLQQFTRIFPTLSSTSDTPFAIKSQSKISPSKVFVSLNKDKDNLSKETSPTKVINRLVSYEDIMTKIFLDDRRQVRIYVSMYLYLCICIYVSVSMFLCISLSYFNISIFVSIDQVQRFGGGSLLARNTTTTAINTQISNGI
jgi:hypothetical protein